MDIPLDVMTPRIATESIGHQPLKARQERARVQYLSFPFESPSQNPASSRETKLLRLSWPEQNEKVPLQLIVPRIWFRCFNCLSHAISALLVEVC